jgi:putative transposase
VVNLYALNYNKRVWIVKQRLKGIAPSKIALAQKISDSMVRRLLRIYNEDGWDGLKDHKTGRPETSLNSNSEQIIFNLRKQYGYGACRIEQILKTKGFGISHRQIEKLLVRNNLVMPNIKKQKCRKWVRYELPNPNDLWHTDWTYEPFSQQNLGVYIDDKTRLITSYGIFRRSTAENSIALLKEGIANYGKPKSIMTDHGSQFYANKGENNNRNSQFRIALDALGIKHYVARVSRPQTNGKVERFFLTFKTEYATGSFSNLTDFIKHYNEERPHMSLGYKTPKEVWNELTKRN